MVVEIGAESEKAAEAGAVEDASVKSAGAGARLIGTDAAAADMDGRIRTLMDWLQEHTYNVLHIHKREDGDLDRVRLRLDEVGYKPDGHSLDGYTEGPMLVLHGQGQVMTDKTEAPLPGGSYAIPLAGFKVTRAARGGIDVQTNRAVYSITPDQSER